MWMFSHIVVDLLFCSFCACLDREFLMLLSCLMESGGISVNRSISLCSRREGIYHTCGWLHKFYIAV